MANKLTAEQKEMFNNLTKLKQGVYSYYMMGFTPAEAHKAAGGKTTNEEHRAKLGSEILNTPEMKALISSVQNGIAEDAGITAEWIAKRLKEESDPEQEGSNQGARIQALKVLTDYTGGFDKNKQALDHSSSDGSMSPKAMSDDDFKGKLSDYGINIQD